LDKSITIKTEKAMKSLVCTLIACFVAFATFAQQDGETPYFTKNFKASEIDQLKVMTSGGSISVKGGATDEARVEMYVRANNWNGKNLSKDEIEERLREYNITVRRAGTELQAIAERKNKDWDNWKRSVSISFKVYVPEKITTDLNTSGGSINLVNLTGKQDFKTSGGSLSLQDIGGQVRGRTSGGSITLNGGNDNIDLQTSGGSITAENVRGNLQLRTSGGSLKLRNLNGITNATTSGGSVRAENVKGEFQTKTSGGSINLSDMDGSVDASTSGGGIEAEISGLGKYLRLSSSAGSIRVKMPLDKGMDLDLVGDRVQVSQMNQFSGSMEKDRVKGTLNGGGVEVKMRTSAGSIYINR
jgi:DUF4097 and DUF4098 domain-containing protein YvlB